MGPLHAFVSVSSEGERLTDSLASTLDEVRIGLPISYARAVIEGVSMADEDLTVPSFW